ncbi:hypothetical protein [Streptococcus merionis]|uniref:hypothetical protein n=1 Tax=Streptococcus merionis TaxID=400065 RepID=UPI0026F12F40|nr:hypothetical protein [Streptococcus merionis]
MWKRSTDVICYYLEQARHYISENPNAHLHLYGKVEAKHNCKMGHVIILTADVDSCELIAKDASSQEG